MNGLKPIKIPSAKEKVASELRKAILSRKMKKCVSFYQKNLSIQEIKRILALKTGSALSYF